jgi:hypothetical protein
MNPRVISVTHTNSGGVSVASLAVNLPTKVYKNSLLLMFTQTGTSVNIGATPAGWQQIDSPNLTRTQILAKIGAPTDSGGTATIVMSTGANELAGTVYQIENWDWETASAGTIASVVAYGTQGNPTTNLLTTPAATLAITNPKGILVISFIHIDWSAAFTVTLPTDISYTTGNTAASITGIYWAYGHLEGLTGNTYNPNDGSLSGSTPVNCFTVVVAGGRDKNLFDSAP